MMIRFLAVMTASFLGMLIAISLLPRMGIAKPTAEIAWTASLYAHKTRIAEAMHGPRVLFVGGSGTLFSLDAETAQRRLRRPVVNFGSHAGLGLSYILDRAERVLRPGDIVVLAPEYELLTQTSATNEYAIQMTAFFDNAYLSHISWREWPNYLVGYEVLPSLAIGIRTVLHHPPSGRTDITLDALGDVRGNTVARSSGISLQNEAPSLRPIAPEMIARLRAFVKTAAAHKVRVIAIPPALISTRGYNSPAFRAFQASLPSLYASLGMTPVGSPDIGFLAPSDMYDSVYHANDRGRAIYTGRVLQALCTVLACRQ